MQKLGIIDIGSNSMRMSVVQLKPDGAFSIIDELREIVRLGEKIAGTNNLREEKIEHAMDTLRFFKNLCDALEVSEIICVATEAVRRVKNRNLFVDSVERELGLQVRVISGLEEAYYDYFGAVNTLNISEALVMDIGGSSTELILIRDRKLEKSISLPFGALTISQLFGLEEAIDDQKRKKLNKFLKEHFGKLEWLPSCIPLVGIGGSFRNLGKIDRKMNNYPLDVTHNYPTKAASLKTIFEMAAGMNTEERKKIKGLSKDRADIFPGALAEIAVLADMTGIEDIYISGSGLREGLFFEHILKSNEPVEDVLDFSLQNILKNYEINIIHANHVWKMAQQLYLKLQDELGIDKSCGNILKTAALLHDCGIRISYYDHHKHSFYMILNSRIKGLTHRELIMAAEVALLHRKDEEKLAAPYRTILNSGDAETIKKLGAILRIAESLDRRQNGNIRWLETCCDKDSIRITIAAKVKPNLEIRDALSADQVFRKVFKKKLSIEEAINQEVI
ncbi:MAG: Ppx/GppA family phosphatase [Clostridiales bacterium]|nr:Ppx/GppA family phosphatase [Clostridiales bacterium]